VKINFKMVNGEEFSIDHEVYAGSAPLKDRKDASVQLSLLMKELLYFTSDQGKIVVVKHIVTAWIED
jgi:hypothetical protein